ncbi:MAG: glycogen/starch synthase [Candidatus Omnitrophota bacterium]
MGHFKSSISSRVFSTFMMFMLLFFDLTIANGIGLPGQDLSPPWIMAEAPSPERETFQREVMSHWMHNYIFLAISKFFLEKQGGTEELKKFLKEELSGREEDVRDMYVFIDEVTVARNKVRIPFKKGGKRGIAETWRAPETGDQRFVVAIRPDDINHAGVSETRREDLRFTMVGKIVASLSLEGFIPELKEPAAKAANMKGGLGVYFADKLRGLAGIGANGMGFQCGYTFGSVDGIEERIDYKKLAEKGIIEGVDTEDEALEVWAGAADPSVTGERHGNNVKTKVEVYRVNRGGSWNYIFVSGVFDRLYPDGSLHRFMQQVVFGKAVYQFMKKHDIRPDILHLNETPPAVAAILMRADDSFDDTAIVYTNHTLVPAGFHDQRFSYHRVGLDISRMEYLLGLPEDKVGMFREYFMRNGDTIDFCHAAMKIADIINAVSDEHAVRTVKLFRDEYGVDLTDKVIGVLNGSGEEWVSDGLKKLTKEGKLPSADEIWDIRESNKAEVYAEIERRTGIKLDPGKLTSWAVRRIVEYKSQYPVLRFIVHVMCSDKKTVFTRESLRALWKRDIPELSGKHGYKVYNRNIEENAEHVLDMLFNGKEEINGRGMQLVIGGPGYEKAWTKQFKKWMHDIPEINGNVVFLEHYSPNHLYMQAVAADICINMPRPFEEACGTSDGRSARNGGVNIALMGAGPVEWMTEYDENTGKGSGFFIGPYTYETADGMAPDLESFYKNSPIDVFGKAEKALGLFERPDKREWKHLMFNAFMDSTFGLEKKAVTADAMETRYAKLVYLNAIAERRGMENAVKEERTLLEQLFEPDVEQEPSEHTPMKAEHVSEYIGKNEKFLIDILSSEAGQDAVRAKLIRIPLDFLAAQNAENVKQLINDIQNTANGYVELYSTENINKVGKDVYAKYGVNRKELPRNFNRTRGNTITLLPVFKRDAIQTRDISVDKIGGVVLDETIVLPTGINYDTSGIIRNVIFGLRITEIVRGQRGSKFIEETLRKYRTLCESQGIKDFDIKVDDLNTLMTGDKNEVVMIINKLIKYMPIAPFNPKEIRQINLNIHEVLIKA